MKCTMSGTISLNQQINVLRLLAMAQRGWVLAGAHNKKTPFPLHKFGYKNLKWKIMFLALEIDIKYISGNQTLINCSGSYFSLSICVSRYLCLLPPFSSLLLFFFFFVYMHPACFVPIFSVLVCSLWQTAQFGFCHLFRSFPTCGVGQEPFTVHGQVLLKFIMFCELNTFDVDIDRSWAANGIIRSILSSSVRDYFDTEIST